MLIWRIDKLTLFYQVDDKDGKYLINFSKNTEDDSSDDDRLPELLSEDGRREILRQKWEKEEEENMKKKDLHYGDVLYDEARTHGAAFYNFSRDETSRWGKSNTFFAV